MKDLHMALKPKDAPGLSRFEWDDPFLIESQLNEDERMMRDAARAYATARRTAAPVSVIMTDIDRFKSFNDEYGHAAGDHALCHFADILKIERRKDDILARVGARSLLANNRRRKKKEKKEEGATL